MSDVKLFNGDCLEIMPKLADDGVKVDLVLTDVPYGTTACKWDNIISFDEMWNCLHNISYENTPIVLFSSQPFTTALIGSNINEFKYEWIWQKAVGSNFATVKYQPLKEHENICVFSKGRHNYYPIKEQRKGKGLERLKHGYKSNGTSSDINGILPNRKGKKYDTLRFPSSIQYFNNRDKDRGYHPTQKPVELLEYLIETYTKEDDLVLDFTMGSGSTGVACLQTNRNFIGIELEPKYFEIAEQRIKEAKAQRRLI